MWIRTQVIQPIALLSYHDYTNAVINTGVLQKPPKCQLNEISVQLCFISATGHLRSAHAILGSISVYNGRN